MINHAPSTGDVSDAARPACPASIECDAPLRAQYVSRPAASGGMKSAQCHAALRDSPLLQARAGPTGHRRVIILSALKTGGDIVWYCNTPHGGEAFAGFALPMPILIGLVWRPVVPPGAATSRAGPEHAASGGTNPLWKLWAITKRLMHFPSKRMQIKYFAL